MSSTVSFGHRAEQPPSEGDVPPVSQVGWPDEVGPDTFKPDSVFTSVGSGSPGRALSIATGTIGYGLAIAGTIAPIYDRFHPSVECTALVLALPLVVAAMVMQSPVSFEIPIMRMGAKSRTLNLALVFPFAFLLAPNLFHAQIDPLWPLIPAAVTGMAAAAAAWTLRGRRDLQDPGMLLLLMGLCGALYGYGATSLIDIQLDASPGVVTPLPVLDMKRSCGRSCSYDLLLASSPQFPQSRDVRVPASLYNAVHKGELVCVVGHPGVLALPWYTVALCDWRPPS